MSQENVEVVKAAYSSDLGALTDGEHHQGADSVGAHVIRTGLATDRLPLPLPAR